MIIMATRKAQALPLQQAGPLVRPARLSEEVGNDLRRRIAAGEFPPGGRLPTEKSLGESFGVSRAVVREAIAGLKADGLIETRQGSGARVVEAPKTLNLRFWQGEGPALGELRDIYELRAMVEGTVAELAARRRNRGDVAAMRRCLKAMQAALAAGGDGSEADDDFHIAIAAATRNGYVSRLVEFLGRHFSDTRKLVWKTRIEAGAGDEGQRLAQGEHQALFEAIAAGDAEGARAAALAHLRAAAARAGVVLAIDLLEHRG
jgi:GntR family transcriptional repressor for pyruvate dehydrogenase complex